MYAMNKNFTLHFEVLKLAKIYFKHTLDVNRPDMHVVI